MDFVGGAGGVGGNFLVGSSFAGAGGSQDNIGPILYSESNRTSAIDDIRSVVIYIFIITIFLSFFLILPGIRNDKFPTFLCITTSLIVTSIIMVSLFGTTWHVADAPISAAYKAFSRDRIQGDLSVNIGLQSVNITLRAHKYYILHATQGPIIMDNTPSSSLMGSQRSQASLLASPNSAYAPSSVPLAQSHSSVGPRQLSAEHADPATVGNAASFISSSTEPKQTGDGQPERPNASLADDLLAGRPSEETELDEEEDFPGPSTSHRRTSRSSESAAARRNNQSRSDASSRKSSTTTSPSSSSVSSTEATTSSPTTTAPPSTSAAIISPLPFEVSQTSPVGQKGQQKFTIKRVNVDINYNERFYWIEPNQMRQEHHNALERGLPYPILTVVEYLSQDEAGFSWSRQYRLAGYYSYIILWLSLCVCALMFFLHCAAPKYGIYMMQILGCLLLFANLTYATLVPRGEQRLVIPFEGQSLTFRLGWNYWLVLIGGCLSLAVGTLIVIIDWLFPNFIFTTILDVDFDSHQRYHRDKKRKQLEREQQTLDSQPDGVRRPVRPPFYASSSSSSDGRQVTQAAIGHHRQRPAVKVSSLEGEGGKLHHLEELFVGPLERTATDGQQSVFQPHQTAPSDSETSSSGLALGAIGSSGQSRRISASRRQLRDSSVFDFERANSDNQSHSRLSDSGAKAPSVAQQTSASKNANLKTTDQLARRHQHQHQPTTNGHYEDNVRL